MKNLSFLICLLAPFCLLAQNYQCLQPGVQHFFTNADGYLRGIRIVSVKSYADSTVYFPYQTRRTWHRDTSGGCWLGKKVIIQNDGTFLFSNIFKDTIVVKPQAHTGDSWIFYNDSSTLYYQADLVAEDTMTFLGTVDSVKKIRITARNLAGLLVSDPVNGFELVLSKNNGFVSVIDLYTFPYHLPDTTFQQGLDYFLDVVTNGSPTVGNSLFTLADFTWPAATQMVNWDVGDVFETKDCMSNYSPERCEYPASITFDSVTSKIVYPDSVHYTTTGWYVSQIFNFRDEPDRYFPYKWEWTNHSFTIPNASFFDATLLPEERRQPYLYYYYHDDTVLCQPVETYFLATSLINFTTDTPTLSEGEPPSYTYKRDLGLVKKESIGSMYYTYEYFLHRLVYYRRNGISCGSFDAPAVLGVKEESPPSPDIDLFPNPAADELRITSGSEIRNLEITNMIGQHLFAGEYQASTVHIAVSDLPRGVYFVRVNGTETKRFVKD